MSLTMDVIGSAVFGINLDCRSDPQNMFAVMGKRYFDVSIDSWTILLMCEFTYFKFILFIKMHHMNSMKLVIPLHSLYWSIHTKDESKRGTTFAFIFGVN